MRVHLASIFSALLVAGCGGNGTPPILHLDAGNGNKGDMAQANNNPDLSMNSSADLTMSQSGTCDLVKQDCSDPNNSKCAAVDDGTGMGITSVCLMPTGAMMTGDSCMRINNLPAGEGHDDCAKGNYCSGLGTLSMPPVRHCRNFCASDADCKNATKCVGLIPDPTMMFYTVGLCAPTCTGFGSDCGQGLNCSNLLPGVDGMSNNLACRQPGSVGTSGACMSDSDCVADAVCIPPTKGANPICSPLCDLGADMGGNLCANGKTCTPLNMGGKIGVCL